MIRCPRKFREEEKETIRQTLLEAAKTMFRQYGIQKTTVAALTEAAGISQGAFYLFFPSKEELFYEVFQMEERKLREILLVEWTEKPLTQERLADRFVSTSCKVDRTRTDFALDD